MSGESRVAQTERNGHKTPVDFGTRWPLHNVTVRSSERQIPENNHGIETLIEGGLPVGHWV